MVIMPLSSLSFKISSKFHFQKRKNQFSTKILKVRFYIGSYGRLWGYGLVDTVQYRGVIVKEQSIGWGWVSGVGGEGEVSTHWCGGVLKNKNGMT